MFVCVCRLHATQYVYNITFYATHVHQRTCVNVVNLPLDSNIRFTSEEVVRFERRYENGFDISSDKRYNAWLKIHGLSGKYQ